MTAPDTAPSPAPPPPKPKRTLSPAQLSILARGRAALALKRAQKGSKGPSKPAQTGSKGPSKPAQTRLERHCMPA
jgi:hypothetical protein